MAGSSQFDESLLKRSFNSLTCLGSVLPVNISKQQSIASPASRATSDIPRSCPKDASSWSSLLFSPSGWTDLDRERVTRPFAGDFLGELIALGAFPEPPAAQNCPISRPSSRLRRRRLSMRSASASEHHVAAAAEKEDEDAERFPTAARSRAIRRSVDALSRGWGRTSEEERREKNECGVSSERR